MEAYARLRESQAVEDDVPGLSLQDVVWQPPPQQLQLVGRGGGLGRPQSGGLRDYIIQLETYR